MNTQLTARGNAMSEAVIHIFSQLLAHAPGTTDTRIEMRQHVFKRMPLLELRGMYQNDKTTHDYGHTQVWIHSLVDTCQYDVHVTTRDQVMTMLEHYPQMCRTPSLVFATRDKSLDQRFKFADIFMMVRDTLYPALFDPEHMRAHSSYTAPLRKWPE